MSEIIASVWINEARETKKPFMNLKFREEITLGPNDRVCMFKRTNRTKETQPHYVLMLFNEETTKGNENVQQGDDIPF